jgi:hypothetical protein
VKCGAELATATPSACPKCGADVSATAITNSPVSLPVPVGDTAITETPAPLSERSVPMSESADADGTRDIANPQAMGPPCPPLLLAGLSTLLGGATGAMLGTSRSGRFEFQSIEAFVGAAIGLVVGLALAKDHVRFVNELKQSRAVAEDGTPTGAAPQPSEAIPIVMLIVPVLAAGVMWFGSSLQLTESMVALVSYASVMTTAVLGYFSIRQIALFAQRSKNHQGALGSPAYMYLATLALWLICFPLHFLARKRMGGSNLVVPGLISTGIFFAPTFKPLFVDAELPRTDSTEVVNLVKQILERDPFMGPVSVKKATEESFDANRQIRVGRCTVATKKGEEEFGFKVTWQNRQTGMWQVELLPMLPPVIAPEVAEDLRDLVGRGRRDPVTVRNLAQLSFDPEKQIRVCQATVVTAAGEAQIRFAIAWEDRELGTWRVKLLPLEP